MEEDSTLANSLYKANITLITKPDKRSTKKGRPQTSISHDLRCKSSGQKSLQFLYKKGLYIMIKWGFIPGVQGRVNIRKLKQAYHQQVKGEKLHDFIN